MKIEAEAAKLAGLQVDLLQKVRSGKITLKQFEEFLNRPTKKKVSPAKHTIDLAKPPCLPFDGAEVVTHRGIFNGKKIVEIKPCSDDNLYINGHKITLLLSQHQERDGKIIGHKLCKELEVYRNIILLNSNVLDYLYDHPELFPEHWKKNEQGEILVIFFWGSIFRDPSRGDGLYVRFLSWFDGGLYRNHHQLGASWSRQDPSASILI